MSNIDEEAIRLLNRYSNTWIDPLTVEERDTLSTFCEMVAELEESSLFKNLLRQKQVNMNQQWTNDVLTKAEILGLDEEHLKAFILTARLFAQNNEPISIANVAQIFERRVGQNQSVAWHFNGYRIGLNTFLDGPYFYRRDPRVQDNAETLSTRQVFETFLYGHYAHKNKEKAATYQRWKDYPGFMVLKGYFLITLSVLFSNVREMRSSILQILADPRSNGNDGSQLTQS